MVAEADGGGAGSGDQGIVRGERRIGVKFHEVAGIFPLMEGKAFDELCRDITANGLRESIWTHGGEIIDGRNRFRACEAVGIKPEYRKFEGSEGELLSFVISMNLKRRHLNESQRAMIAARLANKPLGGASYRSANLQTDPGVSQSDAAAMFSVSPRLVASAKQVLEEGSPEAVREIDAGEIKVNAAAKELKRAKDQSRRSADAIQVDSSILVGDMREIGSRIADNSVDLILTDPPYPEEFLPLFGDLSSFATRVLKPGGLCVVYSGQIHLPDVYAHLGKHLQYLWTFAIRHTGGAQRIFKVGVNTAWKPVLAYIKPPVSVFWDSFIDVCSGGREKDLHDWQQAESEAAYFIEHLSVPGSVICDPFCGSGTVISAAKKLGRQYIGIEIDEAHAQNASRRLQS
jgi:hypothetical protein